MTVSDHIERPGPIPAAAGIGLRGPHHSEFISESPEVSWLEAHSENFFAPGSIALGALERIREDYAVSLHGVGLAIGSVGPIAQDHLEKLNELVDHIQPGLVSEHLCWGSVDGSHLNDLLPLPYTEEALSHMAERIDRVQNYLGRQILIENVSSYMEFKDSTIPEWEFLASVAKHSGCGILLDVNNIFVSAKNHGFDPLEYLDAIPADKVGEIHLAGHSEQIFDDQSVLVDTHNAPVCAEVWTLYETLLNRTGPRPTLIEWDADLPPLGVLLDEARKAQKLMDRAHELAA
ncbi:MAG: MNIO family bufferin maturase [Gammaproteobacteria bacterium]